MGSVLNADIAALTALVRADARSCIEDAEDDCLILPLDGSAPVRQKTKWTPYDRALTSGRDDIARTMEKEWERLAFRVLRNQIHGRSQASMPQY